VISRANADFWTDFRALPKDIQKLARRKFGIWRKDAFHPSLHFKPLMNHVWSVRVNQDYRALARRRGNLVVWFWIGTHAEYDELLKRF